MFQSVWIFRVLGFVLLAVALLGVNHFGRVQAATPFAGAGQAMVAPVQGLLHKADTFRKCQEIYWCGLRRDGTTRCGPTFRCRTCKFTRTCTRALGCVWSEKCRWGPYVPPTPQ